MKQIYGLVGETLSHSLSPQIHSFIFSQLEIDATYQLFPFSREKLVGGFDALKFVGVSGLNVTIPYKTDYLTMVNELSDEARNIGAVNTVTFSGVRSIGHNTDYRGFGYLLERHSIEVAGKSAVVLGSGGAAKTVVCYLLDHGVRDLHVVTRNTSKLKWNVPTWTYDELNKESGDLLVNCTPVGMYPNDGERLLERSVVARFGAVVDLIYNPPETLLLADARVCGLKTCNGLSMLIAQAVYAQELWQGRQIDMAAMEPLYRILQECLPGGHIGAGKRRLSMKPLIGEQPKPLICLPVVGTTEAGILTELVENLAKGPDLIEWRADFFDSIADAKQVLALAGRFKNMAGDIPVIFTIRSPQEGGQFITPTKSEVLEMMVAICRNTELDYVDYELRNSEQDIQSLRSVATECGAKLILSYHNFKQTPTKRFLLKKVATAVGLGADVVKLAVMPQTPADVLSLLQTTMEAKQAFGIPLITMSMGTLGSLTRMGGGIFGSSVTFAVGKTASAPGQIPIMELRKVIARLHD